MRVVTITGGNGGGILLSELKKNKKAKITSIVSSADDGGSSGKIRTELKVFPPGDARQCIKALSNLPKELSNILEYRFQKGFLKGQSVGNILIAGMEEKDCDFQKGVQIISRLLKSTGKVIPASTEPTHLKVRLKNNELIKGENKIGQSNKLSKIGIKKIFLNKNNQANPDAISEIKKADLIILGPGNLYCSLMPILLVRGIAEAINESKAKLCYVANLINKPEHTKGFALEDYVNEIEKYIDHNRIDYIVLNNKRPKNTGSEFVELKSVDFKNIHKILLCPVISSHKKKFSKSDAISNFRSSIIHDGKKLTMAIMQSYNKFK